VRTRWAIVRSIRFRITSLAMLVVVAVLLIVALALLQSVKSHLLQQVDRSLVNESTYVQTQLRNHQYPPATTPVGQLGQFFSANGTLLGSSANLKGVSPLIRLSGVGLTPRLSSFYNRRFGHLRALQTQLGGRSGPILVEYQAINQIVEAENSLTEFLETVLPILALVLGGLIWLVVGRAMKPVEVVRRAVADISAKDLDERLPSPRSGDELDRLVDTMNQMLQRLQAAMKRERRFIADASHELRSPIAAIRGALETSGHTLDGMKRSHDVALSALQRLDFMADGLLTLDSIGGPRTGPPRRPIDLDELVLLQADELRKGTSLVIDASDVSGGQVLAREVDMMRIVENLSSNAVRYAESRVEYSVVERDDHVWLAVTDDGPGIAEPMRAVVFERFARIDSARNRSNGGSGLGLAIVSEIVTAYGGEVWVEEATSHGARFVVRLPATTRTEVASPPTEKAADLTSSTGKV
jgi:signal transduction histidine kinase